MSDEKRFAWVDQIRSTSWEGPFRLALDVLEPLGALGAQLMWVAQPTLRLFIQPDVIKDIALTLEDPDGFERLREQLDAPESNDDSDETRLS